jgi:hypothetical protein
VGREIFEEYGGLDNRIGKLIVDIKDLDVRGKLVGLNDQEVVLRKASVGAFWKILKSKDVDLFQ